MNESLVLRGYKYSVYNRIAHVALQEKGVECDIEEINPFKAPAPEDYLKRHPFGRVLVLSHGTFDIYETVAITLYVDAAFHGPKLVPSAPQERARMTQVISIVDSYGYFPMIRQTFSHGAFRPAAGVEYDKLEISKGLQASRRVLGALNAIAAEGFVLDGEVVTPADCHLAPMVTYFLQVSESAKILAEHGALSNWWERTRQRKSIVTTDPGPPAR